MSLRGRFKVEDEDGNVVFQLTGKKFSLHERMDFFDLSKSDTEPAGEFYRDYFIGWHARYHIKLGGELAYIVNEKFKFGGTKFKVETCGTAGGPEILIDGSFWDREYAFTKNGEPMASVSKKFWQIGDKYGLQIENEEDTYFAIIMTAIIDRLDHENR